MPGWGAARAHALGLVNRLVEPGDVLTAAFELAMAMTLSAPAAVTHMMLGLERIEPPEDVGWSATAAGMEVVLASADRLEGKAAFAERREPRWSPTPPEVAALWPPRSRGRFVPTPQPAPMPVTAPTLDQVCRSGIDVTPLTGHH